MRYTTLALGIVAAACVAASIYLGSELSATREQLAQETQARSADGARIRLLEDERRRLEAALANSPPRMPGEMPAHTPPPGAPKLADAAKPGAAVPGGWRSDRRSTIDDTPAGQNARRTQEEIRLRRTFADMPAALGLDPAQADKLFNLLAESRVNSLEERRGVEDPVARQALADAERQQRDAQIEALLGPQKAAEFQSFEQSLPARMQVGRIGESMAAANVPLSESQRQSLIAAVVAEQQAGPPPERPANPDADYQAKYLDWQADYSRRVQARVEPLLNSAQVAQYRDAVEVQNARRAEQRERAERRARNETGRQ